MTVYAFNNEDTTLTLNGFVVRDLPSDEFIKITFPNAHTVVSYGYSDHSTVQQHPLRDVGIITVKVPRGTESDIFFNNILISNTVTILNGEIRCKNTEITPTNTSKDRDEVYTLKGGTLTTKPDFSVLSLDVEAGYIMYSIQFATVLRIVG